MAFPGAARLIPDSQLIRFLLASGVLTPRDVVEAGARIVDLRRQRFALREVRVGGRATCIVKQALSAEAARTLATEAAALRHLAMRPLIERIAPYCYATSTQLGVIVIEQLESCARLATQVDTDDTLGPEVATAFARSLAAFHDAPTVPPGLGSELPTIFGLAAPTAIRTMPILGVVVRRAHRPHVLRDALERGAGLWRAQCLIHGDVKWEHAFLDGGNDGRGHIRFVDWELAAYGDPAWDLACAVQEYLLTPAARRSAVTRNAPLATADARRLVRAYVAERKRPAFDSQFATRTVLYTAIRLLQTSLELATVDPRSSFVQEALDAAEAVLARADPMTAALFGEDTP